VLQNLLKKTEKAESSYTQGEKNNRAVFLERLGTIYRENNNNQLAIDTFRKMLLLGDDNAVRGYQQIIDPVALRGQKTSGRVKVARSPAKVTPWTRDNMTRSERVIAFCESFKTFVSQPPLAGVPAFLISS
jgi:hypothetical protein